MKKSEIAQYLPEVFQRTVKPGNPLDAVLDIMEAMLDPADEIIDSIDVKLDPRRTIDAMVPFMAHWIDLDWLLTEAQRSDTYSPEKVYESLTNGLGRLRELIANSAYLSKWRGTAYGLGLFLRTAVGVGSIDIEERPLDKNGMPVPFHIKVVVGGEAQKFKSVIKKIVEKEKPAYVTYELVWQEK